MIACVATTTSFRSTRRRLTPSLPGAENNRSRRPSLVSGRNTSKLPSTRWRRSTAPSRTTSPKRWGLMPPRSKPCVIFTLRTPTSRTMRKIRFMTQAQQDETHEIPGQSICHDHNLRTLHDDDGQMEIAAQVRSVDFQTSWQRVAREQSWTEAGLFPTRQMRIKYPWRR